MTPGVFREPRHLPGQDPWVVPFEDTLLLVQSSENNRKLVVRRFADLERMDAFDETVIWAPPRHSDHRRQLWAPELHQIGGRWYLYYAASDGSRRNHRTYVLAADHPLGPYTELGKLFDPEHDNWSIDTTVFRHAGDLYAVWSGWDDASDGSIQNLYIAPMADPWTIAGERRLISRPEHGWELSAGAVNEGPQVLQNRQAGKLFIVYSADASWTLAYKLGLLEWTGTDILDPAAWTKLERPIFTGGGHGCFLETGAGSYLVYHRKTGADPGWADREIRYEPFSWDDDGYPVIGQPDVARPAGRRHHERRPVAAGFPSAADTAGSAPFGPQKVASATAVDP